MHRSTWLAILILGFSPVPPSVSAPIDTQAERDISLEVKQSPLDQHFERGQTSDLIAQRRTPPPQNNGANSRRSQPANLESSSPRLSVVKPRVPSSSNSQRVRPTPSNASASQPNPRRRPLDATGTPDSRRNKPLQNPNHRSSPPVQSPIQVRTVRQNTKPKTAPKPSLQQKTIAQPQKTLPERKPTIIKDLQAKPSVQPTKARHSPTRYPSVTTRLWGQRRVYSRRLSSAYRPCYYCPGYGWSYSPICYNTRPQRYYIYADSYLGYWPTSTNIVRTYSEVRSPAVASSQRLAQQVEDALEDYENLYQVKLDIEVEQQGTVIILKGTVDRQETLEDLVAITQEIEGIEYIITEDVVVLTPDAVGYDENQNLEVYFVESDQVNAPESKGLTPPDNFLEESPQTLEEAVDLLESRYGGNDFASDGIYGSLRP